MKFATPFLVDHRTVDVGHFSNKPSLGSLCEAGEVENRTPNKIYLRVTIDPEMSELFEYLRGKKRKAREALHLMRLGLMCLNDRLGARVVPTLKATTSVAPKTRASLSGDTSILPPRVQGKSAEATGLDGFGALAGLSVDFFAGPPA